MELQIFLAGFNVDAEVLAEARALLRRAGGSPDAELLKDIAEFEARTVWSPESVSAAYARISRDPAPVPELRRRSRREIDSARRSNRAIIFGLGHSSVAEHAVFNFDVLGLSRLAMEAVEHHRLCSFTEKSQRYISLEEGVIVPHELLNSVLATDLSALAREAFADYGYLYDKLLDRAVALHPESAEKKKDRMLLEGMAKEDARYVLPLATPGQLGMTANARNVELLISRLGAHPLAELREFAAKLREAVEGIAPSLIKYTEGAAHLRQADEDLRGLARRGDRAVTGEPDEVRLLKCPADGDERAVASLLFAVGGGDWMKCRERVEKMARGEREELVKTALRRLKSWDAVPRAFEEVSFTFEVVISASCYAQLKRHRMSTQLVQDYDPALGITLPPSIADAELEDRFHPAMRRSEELYAKLATEAPLAAPYALTNAHMRRVLFVCNLRELYHLGRLRLDKHAQWDIREISRRMIESVRKKLPLATAMICGKDRFEDHYVQVFGFPPECGDDA